MQIGELAAATGLSRDALRFYEARGLLTARRRGNGYRDYPPEAVEWLCYLRTAQSPRLWMACTKKIRMMTTASITSGKKRW